MLLDGLRAKAIENSGTLSSSVNQTRFSEFFEILRYSSSAWWDLAAHVARYANPCIC